MTPEFADKAPTCEYEHSIPHRILGLDELRGIAILSVMLAHFFELRGYESLQHLHLGAPGVDLFFIISGFLIAKILLDTKNRSNYFRQFYVRRAFRILPLYFVIVAALTLVSVALGEDYSSWPLYMIFMQNLLHDPIRQFEPIAGLGPLWSLAVEEQFYICLPPIIYFTPIRVLPWALVAIGVVGVKLKYLCYFDESLNVPWGYSNPSATWFRMQYLALGCLLALDASKVTFVQIICMVWLCLVIAIKSNVGAFELGVCIVLLVLVRRCVIGQPLLLQPTLAWLGRLCFGLYLFHLPVLIFIRKLFFKVGFDRDAFSILIAYMLVTLLLAVLSFRLLESPFSRLRTRFEGNVEKLV